jgi:hydroxymethylglutaryl-CoA lyase
MKGLGRLNMAAQSGSQAGKTGPVQRVKIVEVGPRDGLQNEKSIISTDAKLEYITKLADAGLKFIEVTSFVHPKAIPQLYDALEVVRGLPKRQDVHFSALVPNMKGLERAIESGIREIAVFTAASDTFNLRNINMTINESFENFTPVVKKAKQEGLYVRGYVSTAFYCPYEGKIDKMPVLSVSQRLLDLGIEEISIGDTIGQATPDDVQLTMSYLLEHLPLDKVAMHFHDTNGLALENVQASLELGISTYDSSAGGLGGCPYAPGATGNLSTESLVQFLEGRGIATGVDLEKLRDASSVITSVVNKNQALLEDINNLQELTVTPYPAHE